MELALSKPDDPKFRRYSREEFYQMADMGWFRGKRAELIEGEIVVFSPQKWAHTASTDRASDLLKRAFRRGYWVRVQYPVNFGRFTEPEPDISVVPGSRDDYTDHPDTALLIVEVSDTTLAYDRQWKGSLYARAGILDYWIINLKKRQLEVHRDPVPDRSQPLGYRYSRVTTLTKKDFVTPLALPKVRIAVARFFR